MRCAFFFLFLALGVGSSVRADTHPDERRPEGLVQETDFGWVRLAERRAARDPEWVELAEMLRVVWTELIERQKRIGAGAPAWATWVGWVEWVRTDDAAWAELMKAESTRAEDDEWVERMRAEWPRNDFVWLALESAAYGEDRLMKAEVEWVEWLEAKRVERPSPCDFTRKVWVEWLEAKRVERRWADDPEWVGLVELVEAKSAEGREAMWARLRNVEIKEEDAVGNGAGSIRRSSR